MQSLWTSLSGMKSSLNWLDRISNNMANQDTVGFAADKGSFADAYTMALQGNPAVNEQAGRKTPPGWWGGTGVVATGWYKDFSTMPLQQTDNPMDLAIQGDGFFVVDRGDGTLHLTKAGNFTWSKAQNGVFFLATQQGAPVLDTNGRAITARGGGAHTLQVGPDGSVTLDGRPTGQKIAIAVVALPDEKLVSAGDNEYVAKPGAAVRIVNQGNAMPAGMAVTQGALSMSNVDMIVEMTDMIQAQNMFALNAKALGIADRMMQDANNIRS
jgi:flagellar basal body rod protein FlgG